MSNMPKAVLRALASLDEHPNNTALSLRKFQHSSQVLSGNHPRLIDEYPDQWVAVISSDVVAHGKTLKHVLRQVDKKGLSRSDVIVRFIERTKRTLVL